jgi:hypothetical protein
VRRSIVACGDHVTIAHQDTTVPGILRSDGHSDHIHAASERVLEAIPVVMP